MPYCWSHAVSRPLAPPACCSRPDRISWTSLRVTVTPASSAARCSTWSRTMPCRVSRVRVPVWATACWYWASSVTAARWAVAHLVHPVLQLRDGDPLPADDGRRAGMRVASRRR